MKSGHDSERAVKRSRSFEAKWARATDGTFQLPSDAREGPRGGSNIFLDASRDGEKMSGRGKELLEMGVQSHSQRHKKRVWCPDAVPLHHHLLRLSPLSTTHQPWPWIVSPL